MLFRSKRKIGEVASGKSPAAELAAARMAETVSELAVDFIESQKRRQLKSWERQRVILDDNVLPSIGGIKVRDVRRADIKSMLRKIADRPAPVLSNRAHEVVRKMFNFALDEETYGVEYNPALRIQREIETPRDRRSEEHTSELQSRRKLVCRLLLGKKKKKVK